MFSYKKNNSITVNQELTLRKFGKKKISYLQKMFNNTSEEVNAALERQIRRDIQDMAHEARIQAEIITQEGKYFLGHSSHLLN